MSDDKNHHGESMTRRNFLCGATVAVAGVSLFDATGARQHSNSSGERALNDPNILHGKVEFKSGTETIDGYLARPKKKGRYPAVIVIPGSWIVEPYLPETAAMLAQGGFVGLVVNVFHFFPTVATYEETENVSGEVTRKLVQEKYRDESVAQDVQGGIAYLKRQSFVKRTRVGMMGFCGGGASALLCSTQSKDIAAVVPFYAPVNLKLPHRRTPMEVAAEIKLPVQGHYGTKDRGIPLEDVRKFEAALRAQKTPVEIFTYEAGHGFFAYNRDEAYQPEAARLAWERALAFFKRHVK